jgi:hypothetical protein
MNCNKTEVMYPGLFKYQIIDFHYHSCINGIDEAYFDLTFEKNKEILKLRFWSPLDIQIKGSFNPQQGCGLEIVKLIGCYLENINIQVRNFEQTGGNFLFYARKVEETKDSDNAD